MKYFFKLVLLFSFMGLLHANEQVSLQLLWKHQFEFAGFYIAKEKGFYNKANLNVTIKEFDFGINIINDVISEKADFGIGRSSLVLSRLEGKNIVLLNAIYQSSPYVLLSKKRVDLTKVEDFKGKKIMLSDDLASLAAISSMIKVKNLQAKDYFVIQHSFNIDDIINNKVDLMATYLSNEPYYLKKLGINFTIFDPKDYGFDFYADILFSSQKYIKAHPKTVQKFQEATLQGWTYAFEHIDETVDLILKKYNSQNKTKEALLYEAEVLKKLAFKNQVAFGSISTSKIQEIANIFRLLGLTNISNERLEGFIYKHYSLLDKLKGIFSFELFVLIVGTILIAIFLSIYKQFILRKQNTKLEDIVYEKTKELHVANENLELKIKDRTQELEYAIAAKSDFLANMSHEIRTPLNGIIGFIDILYKHENDSEKQKKLQIIKESGSTLLNIINDILDFSKIESQKILLEHAVFNITDVFTHIVALFADKASEKEILIKLNIDKNIPTITLGDSTRVKQVFSNLLSNAIKFSHRQSEVIVNLNYLKDSNTLYCEVIDFGLGIQEKNIAKVFNSFEQADSSVTRTYGGSGLGLAISKALVELMQGQIGVKSDFGKGSTFYFSIALFETEDMSIDTGCIDYKNEDLSGLVLIVEDNKTNQILLSILLDELGLEYELANDGIEAVEAVKKKHYDMILMDENMPNMNGIKATKIIKTLQKGKNTPIVAVTANALKGDKEKFLDAGMNDYLIKPVDADKLTIILHKYLGK